jgi:hypothetical protein
MTIWYISCSFGTFVRFLVSCTKKNLATLIIVRGGDDKNEKFGSFVLLSKMCFEHSADKRLGRSFKKNYQKAAYPTFNIFIVIQAKNYKAPKEYFTPRGPFEGIMRVTSGWKSIVCSLPTFNLKGKFVPRSP